MKHGYKNPVVTYDEIVEAIKAIIECSLNNNYMDDFDYLNLKYESESSVKYEGAEERVLYKAVKSLEKTIDSANKIIKDNLEQGLRELELSRFTIHVDYLIGQERRKLAASQSLIEKLSQASIELNSIFNTSYEEEISDKLEPITSKNEDLELEKIIDGDLSEDEYETEEKFELEKIDEEIEDTKEDNDIDTNKEYSDFEKKVLISFPEFFKEELEIARSYEDVDSEDVIDAEDLFNTMELEPISMDYVAAESLDDEEDDSDVVLPKEDEVVDINIDSGLDLDFVMPSKEVKKEVKEAPKTIESDELAIDLDNFKAEPVKKNDKEVPEIVEIEEPVKETEPKKEEKKKLNKGKIILLKKAIDKAKSLEDDKLVEALKKQLAKELGVGK